MPKTARPFALLALLLAALGALPAAAATDAGVTSGRETALGADGEVFHVLAGPYGQLFPGSAQFTAATPVLALEISQPGEFSQRLLVPDTGNLEVERIPAVIYEPVGNTAFLVWESWNGSRSQLRLAAFDGSRWSSPLPPISGGSVYSPKTLPQIAVTRDASGEGASRARTVVHMLWSEDRNGGLEILYLPVILQNGSSAATPPVYRLSDFETSLSDFATTQEPSPAFTPSGNLVVAPSLQQGRDEHTVVIGFTSHSTRRVVTLEVSVLPEELASLAGGIRSQIVDLGARLSYPANVKQLADRMRSFVLQSAADLEPEVALAIANRVAESIQTQGGKQQSLLSLAGGIRSQIVDLGAKLDRGVRKPRTGSVTSRIEEVAGFVPYGGVEPVPNLLQFRVISSRPVPSVGTGDVALFQSRDGNDVLISWSTPKGFQYRLSRGTGWGSVIDLPLGGALTPEKAFDILERRVRER